MEYPFDEILRRFPNYFAWPQSLGEADRLLSITDLESGKVEHLVFYSAEKDQMYARELGGWHSFDPEVFFKNIRPPRFAQRDVPLQALYAFERQEYMDRYNRIRENNYRNLEAFPLVDRTGDHLTTFPFDHEPEPEWAKLTSLLAAMITLAPEFVVLQTYTEFDGDCGPYVQTLQEDEGALTIEASSDAFLDPPIGSDAINTLLSMGWELPEREEGLPNFFICLEPDEVHPGKIAQFLVETLQRAFLVKVDDTFEFAPQDIFLDLVNGKYGEFPGIDVRLGPPKFPSGEVN